MPKQCVLEVGGILGTDLHRLAGGGGVGSGGLLCPASCVDGGRFVVILVGCGVGSIFGACSPPSDFILD